MLAAVSRSACLRVAVSSPTQVQSIATATVKATNPGFVMANIRSGIAWECATCIPTRDLLETKGLTSSTNRNIDRIRSLL